MPGTAHVLKGEPMISVYGSQGKSQTQPGGGGSKTRSHGIAVWQRGTGDGASEGSRPAEAGQPALTAWEKSAEGILAGGNEP